MVDSLIPLEPRRVARVAVDVSLAHLDRLFDYEVPDDLAEKAVVGARVRVKFAGKLRDGFIVEVAEDAEHDRALAPLEKVVSAEPVLEAPAARLIRSVADHYAGVFADVMRLAVPPRHAATEKAERSNGELFEPVLPMQHPLLSYPTGESFVQALTDGHSPRAAWQIAPTAGEAGDWARGLAVAAGACVASGRRAVLVVPDVRDLRRLEAACEEVLGVGQFVTLTADAGPATRYRSFLAASRGDVPVVIGTRAAAYVPVRNLGLLAVWDDGDDLHAEQRSPYPNTREVLALRAAQQECALLVAAYARSCETQWLVERRWLHDLALTAGRARRLCPAVRITADSDWDLERDPIARQVRMPREVFEVIRSGLAVGPVLVQVARTGYLVALVCNECRTPVRCPHCDGPIRADRERAHCGWCARPLTQWRCPECSAMRWRAPLVGAVRTAEELGRAFPNVRVIQSQGDRVLESVPDEPSLVIATPGAEPPVDGAGYAAAVLLDTEQQLTRADLRAGEEALRRWLNAVALVRPADQQGTVIAVGASESSVLQALVRLDPIGYAARELAERVEAHLPPAYVLATVEGEPTAVAEMATLVHEELGEVEGFELLGPVELPSGLDQPKHQLILRAPGSARHQLVTALKHASGVRSAKKAEGAVRVCVDPVSLG